MEYIIVLLRPSVFEQSHSGETYTINPPLGDRSEVLKILINTFEDIEVESMNFAVVEREKYKLQFYLGEESIVTEIIVSMEGEEEDFEDLKNLCLLTGWRALDVAFDLFINFEDESGEGFETWKKTRQEKIKAIEKLERKIEEEKKYTKIHYRTTPFLIISMVVAAVPCWLVLSVLANLRFGLLSKRYLHLVHPQWSFWAVISVFAGIILAYPLFITYLRHRLKEDFQGYYRYSTRLGGGRIFLVIVVGATICGVLVGYFLGLGWYTAFDDMGVTINHYWSISPQKYSYDQVEGVYLVNNFVAPSGKIISQPHYVIRFVDGEIWSSWYNGRDNERPETDTEIMRFIANRINKDIQEITFIEKLSEEPSP